MDEKQCFRCGRARRNEFALFYEARTLGKAFLMVRAQTS